MKIQTRSEKTGLCFHNTLQNALDAAKKDHSIWKISFSLQNGERVRMIRNNGHEDFRLEQITLSPDTIIDTFDTTDLRSL